MQYTYNMTIKGGTTPACAACKYQRRKCSSDCILAPYFPANQPKVFQNVHRLFGVSKIMKILKELETNEQKEDALTAIKYESDMRQRFPIYGCLMVIYQLRQQLQLALEELHHVHAQLAIYRQQFNNSPPSQSSLQLALASSSSNETPFVINDTTTTNNYLPKAAKYSSVFSESGNDDNMAKPHLGLDMDFGDLMRNNNNSIPFYEQLVSSDAFGIQKGKDISQEYEDMILNNVPDDDRQSYIETEACESSSESSLTNTTQLNKQGSKNELKNVAARFSLIRANKLEQSF